MKIRNINGTSQSECNCGSWLKHWKKLSGQTINFCPEESCFNTDLVGAHVQKAGSEDERWYILPLCSEHNQSTEELEVADAYPLVSANKNKTCEK